MQTALSPLCQISLWVLCRWLYKTNFTTMLLEKSKASNYRPLPKTSGYIQQCSLRYPKAFDKASGNVPARNLRKNCWCESRPVHTLCWGISCFFSVPPGKLWGTTSDRATTASFRLHCDAQFNNYPTIRSCTVWATELTASPIQTYKSKHTTISHPSPKHSNLTLNHRSEFVTIILPLDALTHPHPEQYDSPICPTHHIERFHTSRFYICYTYLPLIRVYLIVLTSLFPEIPEIYTLTTMLKSPTALYSSAIAITSSTTNRPARTNLDRLDHRYLWFAAYFLAVIPFFLVCTSTFSWCVQIFVIVTITAHRKQFAMSSVTP